MSQLKKILLFSSFCFSPLVLSAENTPSTPTPATKSPPQSLPRQPKKEDKPQVLPIQELKEYQERLKKFDFLTVEFKQKTYKELRKNTVISEGRASFHKPNQFRWSTLSPLAAKEEWIFTGKELFNQKKDTATQYPASGTIGKEIQQVVDMVINFEQLLQKYALEKTIKEGFFVTLVLIPLVAADLNRAELKIDLQKNYIAQVQLFFFGGNQTSFEFNNPDTQALATTTFMVDKGIIIKPAL